MNAAYSSLRSLLRTSTFQLTLLYVAMFSVSVLVLSGILYWSTIGSLDRQINATIEVEIAGLAEQYERQGLRGLIDVVAERVQRDTEGRSIYLFTDASLRPLAGNLDHWPSGSQSSDGWFEFERNVGNGHTVPVRAKVLAVGRNLRLLVGQDIRELAQLDRVFERAAIVGTGAVLLLALAGGLLMSVSAQRRVSRINRTARHIIDGDLSQRVPVSGSRDEYDGLAANFNAMLDQIVDLLEGMRHVGDSVAHDLKAPLTRLRNRLENAALSVPPNVDDLNECVAETDRLLATFNALLRIARIESGAYRTAFQDIDLAEIVRDACDLYRAAADDKNVSLNFRCEKPARMFGDRQLLSQAVTNLLDNAVKYTQSGGHVDVEIQTDQKDCSIIVADSGPGIPNDELANVQRRFVRLDCARSEPGNGLGLALVRAVADQHRGSLLLGSNNPGLRAVIELPRAAAVPAP